MQTTERWWVKSLHFQPYAVDVKQMESSAARKSKKKNAFAFIEFLQFLIRVFSCTLLLQPSLFRCKRSGNEFYCRMVFSLKLKTTSQWFALLLNIHKNTYTQTYDDDWCSSTKRTEMSEKMSFIWKRRKRRKFYCISEKMKTCSWNKARWVEILINGTAEVSEV